MNEVTSENPVPDTIRVIQTFALAFQRGGLYETGYADPWREGGATTADTRENMLCALGYVMGAADTARLACPYQGRSWRIAHLMGEIAGTLMLHMKSVPEGYHRRFTVQDTRRVIDTFTRELFGILADTKLGV